MERDDEMIHSAETPALGRKKHFGRYKKPSLSRSKGGTIAIFIFLIMVSVFMVMPMVYTIVQSLKPINEIFLYPPRFFVQQPTLDNFTMMIQLVQGMWVPFERYLFNSLFVAIVGTGLYIVVASMAAYPLSKLKFRYAALYYQIIVWAILFRPEVTRIPQYVIIAKLGLINTYLSIILPVLATSFGVFLMRQFMITVPDEIIEAAKIDGVGHFTMFTRIIMPMVKPAWLTLIIFTFQQLWNTTGGQYIYDETVKMLPTVLQQISSGGIARSGAGAAVALILMIPPITVFIISQSSVMETMAQSGIK